jgi:signal transduction histidine kinase
MISGLLKSRGWFLVVISFLQYQAIYSQDSSYIIQHFTNENGLPVNGVTAIELDKTTGFLWVGTHAGLLRFDGTNFKNFNSGTYAAAVSRINVIVKNKKGVIYYEDNNSSIYRIVNNRPEFVMTDSLISPTFFGRDDISYGRPVNQIIKNILHNDSSSFRPYKVVFHEKQGDTTGFSLVQSRHAYHYSITEDSLFDFPGIEDLFELGGAAYFIDLNLHLWEYSDSLKKLTTVPVKGMPGSNTKDGENPQFLWKPGMKEPLVIINKDIWKLQRSGNSLSLVSVCRECCPQNAHIVTAQTWNEQEIIFLGSDINGLYVIRKPFVRSVGVKANVEAVVAEYAQAEITPGVITTGSGLSFSTQGNLLYGERKIQSYPYTAFKDKRGDHWFHSGDTVIRLRAKDGHLTKIADQNLRSLKLIFAETQDRIFVISDIAIGEITGDRYKLLYRFSYPSNAIKNFLNPDAAIELKPGTLAIAAEKLVLFNVERKEVVDTVLIPGLTTKVRALLKHGNYLLIGTYGQGFYIYKDGIVKKMPLDKYQHLIFSHCFLADENGFCWISSNRGLFKVSFKALIAAYENNLPEIYFQYFGKSDGIFNIELNGGCQPCALKLSNGLFSFPSMNGVLLFDPRLQHITPPPGQVFVDEMWVDTIMIQPANGDLYQLPHNVKTLRFQLVAPLYGNPENIYFSYKLEPFTGNWESQDIIKNNVLQFGGLSPGNYKLFLRVRNGYEPNEFGVQSISFRVLKPWYQSWWFFVFCFLLFLSVLWLLVRLRTATINKRKKELQQLVSIQTRNLQAQSKQLETQLHQLKAQQEELEEDSLVKARLISIISHDMISPLKFMAEGGKELREAFATSNPLRNTADSIVNITEDLETLSVNILNWIRFHHKSYINTPELFDLSELVNESIEIATTLAASKNVQVKNDVPPNIFLQQNRQAVSVIVYNLVMNAVKHTDSGEIRIAIEKHGENVLLTVTDTGSGMAPDLVERLNSTDPFIGGYAGAATKKHQFGFVIIKDLLRLVGGEMNVKSGLNTGTTVFIELRGLNEKKIKLLL